MSKSRLTDGSVVFHEGYAFAAESTARSTSSACAADTVAKALPVLGFSTSSVAPLMEGTYSLSMKSPVETALF